MWQAIQYVTTPLTLLAFVVAVGAYVYRLRASKVKTLIDSAPEAARPALVEGALRDFKTVDTANLTKAQQYEIALRSLGQRERRLRIIGLFAIILFFLLCAVLVVLALINRAPAASVAVTYESVSTYPGLHVKKPVNWFLVNDGESPTYVVENPEDEGVYITVSPLTAEEYEANEAVKCRFVRNVSAGSAGPEPDGVAPMKQCAVDFDGIPHEEMVLYIHGRMTLQVRCGYATDKARLYRDICNTVVGTTRYAEGRRA
jgi:hypothetical protein